MILSRPTPRLPGIQPMLAAFLSAAIFSLLGTSVVMGSQYSLDKGAPIPPMPVMGTNGQPVNLNSLKGRVTLISIVPQLNTPVCDEQTHRFSERNGGLDQFMTFVTLSTNTYEDQQAFANKAHIHNMTFLSDAPEYHFGSATGLLLPELSILQRTVVILDSTGIIRYVEKVSLGQLPDIEQALRVSRTLLETHSEGVMP